MQELQADQTTISGQTSELSTLGTLFGNLQTSIQSLESATGGNAQSATVSDSTVLQANLTGSALPGTYTVQVLDPGSSSSALSNASVADPTSDNISSSSSFTLTANGNTYTIQPAAANLNSLASAINASGAQVQAVVINTGTPESPSYQLIIQSTALGDSSVQLNDGSNDLMSSLTTGGDASYTVNGQPPNGITSDSSTVTIAPGLNVTLQNTTGTATVTVAGSLSSVSSALSSFVSSYNAAVTELQKNFGQNGGALVGDSSVLDMEQALTQLVNYTGSSGSITSLAQLGVEFTQQGTLTLDSSAISNLSSSQINDALTFLGDADSGYLQYATNTLDSITDPTDGVIATETQSLQNQNQQDQNQINTDQAQLTQLQTNLQNQMAQSNALIATLQEQDTFLQGLFQADTSTNPYAIHGWIKSRTIFGRPSWPATTPPRRVWSWNMRRRCSKCGCFSRSTSAPPPRFRGRRWNFWLGRAPSRSRSVC